MASNSAILASDSELVGIGVGIGTGVGVGIGVGIGTGVGGGFGPVGVGGAGAGAGAGFAQAANPTALTSKTRINTERRHLQAKRFIIIAYLLQMYMSTWFVLGDFSTFCIRFFHTITALIIALLVSFFLS